MDNYTIEEKQREIEKLTAVIENIETKKKTEEEIKTENIEKEIERRKAVFSYYEIITGKPMTEEKYKKYIEKFNTPNREKAGMLVPRIYTLKTFIKEENDTNKELPKQE